MTEPNSIDMALHEDQFRAASLRLMAFFESLLARAPDAMSQQDVSLVIMSAAIKALIASHGVAGAVHLLRVTAVGLEREAPKTN